MTLNMITLASNKRMARELIGKVLQAELDVFDKYKLMMQIALAITADGDNDAVRIELNDAEEQIEKKLADFKKERAELIEYGKMRMQGI